jgi:hypothetical protein
MATVLKKTQKGMDEISTRQHGLTAKFRSVLIMVDAKHDLDSLLKKLAHMPEAADIISALIANGFVESVAGVALVPASATATSLGSAATPVSATAIRTASPEKIRAVRQAAVRELNNRMGPAADSLCIKIEQAKTLIELETALEQVRGVLERNFSKARADSFWLVVAPLLE